MRTNVRAARRSPGAVPDTGAAPRPLVLMGAAAVTAPARPHWLGAACVVFTLGAVVTVAALAATFFPGLLPAILLS